jgi:hypothetical protein
MSQEEILTCGHHPRDTDMKWVTVFYPNRHFPWTRFCDVECMILWHEEMRARLVREIREEQARMMRDSKHES